MISRYFTGVDNNGNKVSISYDVFKKNWRIVEKDSKDKIYLVPAENFIYLKEETDINNYSQIINYYKLIIEERYPGCEFDIYIEKYNEKNIVHIMVIKDFKPPPRYYALDGEIFSLKRLLQISGESEGFVFNLNYDRVVCVYVKNGHIQYYRVIKRELKTPEDTVSIVEQLPYIEKNKPLITVGILPDDIKRLLSPSKVIEKDEKSLALSCSLKPLLDNEFLSFRKNEFTKEEINRLKIISIVLISIYIFEYFFLSFFVENKIKELKFLQSKIFKSVFPDVPIVSPYSQLKANVKTKLEFELSKKLANINLPKNSKIYSIEYFEGVLIVKGEASEPPQIAKSIKKTPSGNFEFEIEVK